MTPNASRLLKAFVAAERRPELINDWRKADPLLSSELDDEAARELVVELVAKGCLAARSHLGGQGKPVLTWHIVTPYGRDLAGVGWPPSPPK